MQKKYQISFWCMGHLLVDDLICRDWWGHSTGYHPVQPRLPERALAKGLWKCKRSCEEDAWSQPLLSVDCPAGSRLVIQPHSFPLPKIVWLNESDHHLSPFNNEEHPWIQNASAAPNIPLGEAVRSRLKQFTVMNKFKKKALLVSRWSFLDPRS